MEKSGITFAEMKKPSTVCTIEKHEKYDTDKPK